MPCSDRSRAWLASAIVECYRCHQIVDRTSPMPRHCPDCRREIKRARSREAIPSPTGTLLTGRIADAGRPLMLARSRGSAGGRDSGGMSPRSVARVA